MTNQISSVLFVCTGNSCRSPMAESLLKKIKPHWKIASAGTHAYEGIPASTQAVEAMKEISSHIKNHRSQALTSSLLKSYDTIVCMQSSHMNFIQESFSHQFDSKLFLINQFSSCSSPDGIPDPIALSLNEYKDCLNKIIFFINEMIKSPLFQKRTDKTLSIAIASDHRGVQLKKNIFDYLQNKPYNVTDYGPSEMVSVDYPDYAKKVIEKIEESEYNRGILICGTGIGMSIVANRSYFIRAALCHDEQAIELSRKHNDSNVLCLSAIKHEKVNNFSFIDLWLETSFDGDRHQRRLNKIDDLRKRDIS